MPSVSDDDESMTALLHHLLHYLFSNIANFPSLSTIWLLGENPLAVYRGPVSPNRIWWNESIGNHIRPVVYHPKNQRIEHQEKMAHKHALKDMVLRLDATTVFDSVGFERHISEAWERIGPEVPVQPIPDNLLQAGATPSLRIFNLKVKMEVLKDVFAHNRYPDQKLKAELADELGMSYKMIHVSFPFYIRSAMITAMTTLSPGPPRYGFRTHATERRGGEVFNITSAGLTTTV